MIDNTGNALDLSKFADVILRIAALIGVAATIASFGYNFIQCNSSHFGIAVSLPVFLLAFLVFGIALGLTDKTFGNFRDIDFSSGAFLVKVLKLLMYILGYLMEVSLFIVAYYVFRVAGSVQNCLP